MRIKSVKGQRQTQVPPIKIPLQEYYESFSKKTNSIYFLFFSQR